MPFDINEKLREWDDLVRIGARTGASDQQKNAATTAQHYKNVWQRLLVDGYTGEVARRHMANYYAMNQAGHSKRDFLLFTKKRKPKKMFFRVKNYFLA